MIIQSSGLAMAVAGMVFSVSLFKDITKLAHLNQVLQQNQYMLKHKSKVTNPLKPNFLIAKMDLLNSNSVMVIGSININISFLIYLFPFYIRSVVLVNGDADVLRTLYIVLSVLV